MSEKTATSTRQVISRTLLNALASKSNYAGTSDNKPANSTELKNLLSSIDSILTNIYGLTESLVPDLTLNVGSDTIQNPETLLNRINPHTGGSFAGGTIVFPSADGGVITVSPGINSTLNCASGFYIKALVQIDGLGQLSIKQSLQNAVLANIVVPEEDAQSLAIGFVVLYNNSGTVENVINDNIFQYSSGGGGGSNLTVQEKDSNPNITEVSTLRFPNNTLVDEGGGVVSVNIESGQKIINDQGNGFVKLKPFILDFTLQSPDLTKWYFTTTEEGILVSESGSTNDVSNIKILRDDNVEVSFRVGNDGLLQVVNPAESGMVMVDNVFLESPTGVAWELRVTTTAAAFALQSPDGNVWDVSVTDTGALETTVGSIKEPSKIKLKRTDLTEIGLFISNEGKLITNDIFTFDFILKPTIYLASPDNTVWEVKIDNSNILQTETAVAVFNKSVIYTSSDYTVGNKLLFQTDQEETIFGIREYEELDFTSTLKRGFYLEMPILTYGQIEAIEIPDLSSSTVTAEVYVDTGAGIRKAFFDIFDNKWKFVHNLAELPPFLPATLLDWSLNTTDTLFTTPAIQFTQVIKPNISGVMNRVLFYSASKTGSPVGTINVDIYLNNGSATGIPDGTLLTSATTRSASSFSVVLTHQEFVFPSPIYLNSSNYYLMHVYITNPGIINISNTLRFGQDPGNETVDTNIISRISTNGGISWAPAFSTERSLKITKD